MSHRTEIQVPESSPRKVGVVESDARSKTRKVAINFSVKHPKYGKYVTRHVKYKAHDENNTCAIGDKVMIVETRPLSKDKRWRVVEVLERGTRV